MKKVLISVFVFSVLMCLFALGICAAEPSYADGEWIYASDGETKLTLRDTDGNPLIWYMNGDEIKYVRADQTDETQDVYVKYSISSGGNGFDTKVFLPEKCLKSIKIYDNGTEILCSSDKPAVQFALLMNLEHLDIDAMNGWLFGNKNGCCPLLRGIYLPSTLKGIGQEGFTNTRLVQVWNLENTQLFYVNACDPFSTSTLTQEATGGVLRNPQTMMRPFSAAYSKITTYYMNPYMDYPNLNQLWHQIFRECSNLQHIYAPAQVSIGYGSEAFRGTPSQYILFLTGTKADAENAIANTDGSHNSAFKNAKAISYAEYLLDKETYESATKQVYVVYDYGFCDAFFGGHSWKGENDVIFEDYFKPIGIGDTCKNCGEGDVKETIAPIFVWKGYSASTFGDKYAVVQGFYIDRDSLAQYKAFAPDFDFGIMATGNAKGEAINPQIGDEKVFTAIFDNTVNDYYDIKVTGITQELMDKNIVFCIYVLDGGKMYYLDGEKTGDTVTGISYESILSLENEASA